MNHLENNILAELRHDFRKHQSCEARLTREQVDSMLLDFRKAFHKVCHLELLLKLERYGIRGRNLQRMKKFLENRLKNFCCWSYVFSVRYNVRCFPRHNTSTVAVSHFS